MNWIIAKSDKMPYHTHLGDLLIPILPDIERFSWCISDLECTTLLEIENLLNYEQDYFLLSPAEFQQLIIADVQFIWAVILGVSEANKLQIDEENLPFAEFNNQVWKDGNIQHPQAVIEILCFDSSYTIVKFKDRLLSEKFKAYWTEAIELERFKG